MTSISLKGRHIIIDHHSGRHLINADVDRTRRRRLRNLATLYAIGRVACAHMHARVSTSSVRNNSISMAMANLIVPLVRARAR